MGRTAANLLVECLEAEGVEHVFGIPGEETLDLNEALADSAIEFVPVRHEQGGAYIADVYGRLTGRAGVCLGTLGPGATNLVTAVADAFLDRAPLVALTGQADLERQHKESHQHIDVAEMMRPITKWNARLSDPEIVAEVVRKAFKVAESEKPGSTHIELPEDVMAAEVPDDAHPLHRRPVPASEPPARVLMEAAGLINGAENAVCLAGNGVVRAGAAPALREFARATGIPVAVTFMGKGLMESDSDLALGAVGLQAGDFSMAGFDDADVVITVGYDLVEHSPALWNPSGDKRVVCIDSLPAEIDENFMPEVELVGDVYAILLRLAQECRDCPSSGGSPRLRQAVDGILDAAIGRRLLPGAAAAGAARDPRGARPRGHPGLRRRPAQAVDRAGLPRLRAQHGADRQRPGGDGVRGPGGDRREAGAPEPQGRGGLRRRRLPHELPGARDRDAAEDRVRERRLGEPPVRVDRLEAGEALRPPLRDRLPRTPTSSSSPSRSGCRPGAASRSTTTGSGCARRSTSTSPR